MDLPERPNYYKRAFANLYNLCLLAGATVMAAGTGEWIILAGAAVLETIFMTIVPDLPQFKEWSERVHRRDERFKRQTTRVQRLNALGRPYAVTGEKLINWQKEMGREIERNENWSGDLMRDEYEKLDSLLDAYVELAEALVRFENYRADFSIEDLNRSVRDQQRTIAKKDMDSATKELAEKNIALIQRRIDTLGDMGRFIDRTRAQMDVIDNTFALVYDQIVCLKSNTGIGEQLDEILHNVDAVRTVLHEGDLRIEESTPPPVLRRVQ